MRTFDRVTFEAARDAWATGRFGPEWHRIRAIAADRGFLFPPSGSVHDDRDAAEPSQRAIVYRALADNPAELERIVSRSRSWSQVVDRIIGFESRLREDAGLAEDDARWDREQRPTAADDRRTIANLFERVADSLGYVRRDAS